MKRIRSFGSCVFKGSPCGCGQILASSLSPELPLGLRMGQEVTMLGPAPGPESLPLQGGEVSPGSSALSCSCPTSAPPTGGVSDLFSYVITVSTPGLSWALTPHLSLLGLWSSPPLLWPPPVFNTMKGLGTWISPEAGSFRTTVTILWVFLYHSLPAVLYSTHSSLSKCILKAMIISGKPAFLTINKRKR